MIESVIDPGLPLQARSDEHGLVLLGLDGARVATLRERVRSLSAKVEITERDDGAVAVRLRGATNA
jgi:hypothetical protein